MRPDYSILPFKTAKAFRTWLDKNHAKSDGVWLQLYKKASDIQSVTYAEALDEALCYGWIDGQRKSHDEVSFLQKFTPRRPRSLWSKRNIQYIERLRELGIMMPAGEAEVARAQADGRWEAAYDGPSNMTIPESFLAELAKHPAAQAKFDAMSKSARYYIGWQLQTAKTQKTIDARTVKIINELNTAA